MNNQAISTFKSHTWAGILNQTMKISLEPCAIKTKFISRKCSDIVLLFKKHCGLSLTVLTWSLWFLLSLTCSVWIIGYEYDYID